MQLARRAVSATIIGVCLAIVIGVFWLFFLLDPLVIGIDCDDSSIRKERKKSKMPELYLTVGAAVVCIVSLTVTEVALRFIGATKRTQHRVLFCWVPSFVYYAGMNFVAYLFGTHFTQGVVFLLKKITGRLRPDFWEVCRPVFPAGSCPDHTVSFDYRCANLDETEVSRARQTFPSGHASYAFFVATFLTIYFDRRLQTRREWSYVKKTVEFLLFCVAIWVAYERCQANAHHPFDAWVGSIIGIIGAFFTWPLLHTRQSLPVPNFSPADETNEPDRHGHYKRAADYMKPSSQPVGMTYVTPAAAHLVQNPLMPATHQAQKNDAGERYENLPLDRRDIEAGPQYIDDDRRGHS